SSLFLPACTPIYALSLHDALPISAGGLYFTITEDSDAFNLTGKVFYLPAGEDTARLVLSGLAFPNGISITPDGAAVIVSEFASKDRKSTRLNSSHVKISYAVFCLK